MADAFRERGQGEGHSRSLQRQGSSEDSNDSGGAERQDSSAPHQPSKSPTSSSSPPRLISGQGGASVASSPARATAHLVSRPPSSHITRVEEEDSAAGSSTDNSGRRSGGERPRSVETVDRGVGPTPAPQLPPPPAPGSSAGLAESRLPPYVSFHPFADPRNGLLEAYAAAGLTYAYPGYPYPINAPLPLNTSTLEGRYHWPPTASPLHAHQLHGLSSSPTPSDISLLSMRSPMLPGEPVTQLASRIHWEQLHRNYYHPLSGRRFSPASLPGLPFGASPLIGEYPPPSLSGRSLFSDVPPTPGSGSITLPGSLESSRLTSPRPSIVGGSTSKSRKRALSHSPISDYLDIQSLTRSSEGSLQLTPFLQHSNSRSSSAASGSYGHLSAASVGTVSSGHPMLPSNPFLRSSGVMGGHPGFFYPPFHPLMGKPPASSSAAAASLHPHHHHHLHPHHPHHSGAPPPPPHHVHGSSSGGGGGGGHSPGTSMLPPGSSSHSKYESQISTTTKEPGGSSSIVSSTMDSTGEHHKVKVKKEATSFHSLAADLDEDDEVYGERGGHIPQEGEPDFIETNCRWVDCNREFDTQDDLVKHINQDHIQSNKKAFVCRWTECSREEKPFKAQYMLVVHMRRHTGEKPHRCTFEGCNKAYSRLENLKTHLRSHTGEKPYMCEFPGCSKAFSNASDRAKHQNRTHSNAKPYVCKAVGCTKRYTDPSSLRKHVKTVHGADFYANKKHKGDSTCHMKKEDPDGEDDFCEMSRGNEDSVGGVSSPGQSSSHNPRSQENIGSAPSSHSQPSPDSSPEVNVICGLGLGHGHDEGHIIEDALHSRGIDNSVGMGIEEEEEEEVVVPECNEADVPGSSGALLTRRNQINAGHVMHSRVKGRINNKTGSISPHPQMSGGPPCQGRGLTQLSITDHLPQRGTGPNSPQTKLSPQHKRITDIMGGEQVGSWRDTNSLMPESRRESNTSNTSTLSSYMSSMRSMGSTFSSRRSSQASQFSSRRSSGISARMSIINSPYEYDITGNLPGHPSRRSSGESSANIGSVSAMMQQANLGSHPNLVVTPASSSMMPGACFNSPGGVMTNGGPGASPVGGVASGMGSCGGQNYNGAGGPGFGHSMGQKYYNERLARYFAERREMDGGMRTSTPCRTPLPHELPDREIRRASDPVRTQDPDFNSLKRYHSLNAVKPQVVPASMKSLQAKSIGQHNACTEGGSNNKTAGEMQGSNATFQSSRSSIATDAGRGSMPIGNGDEDSNKKAKDRPLTEAELEVKMLEDSEDMIIPDEMRRFLNEEGFCEGVTKGDVPLILAANEERSNLEQNDDRHNQRDPLEDLVNGLCENDTVNGGDMQVADQHQGVSAQRAASSARAEMLAGNLTVQTGFADLHNSGALSVDAGGGGSVQMDNFQASPTNRANFASPGKPLSAASRPPQPASPPSSWHMMTDESCDEASPKKTSNLPSDKSKSHHNQKPPTTSYFQNTKRTSIEEPDTKDPLLTLVSPPMRASAGTGALIPPSCVKTQAEEVPLSTCRQQQTQQTTQSAPAGAGVSQGNGVVSNMDIAAGQPGSHPASRHGSWDVNSAGAGTAYLSEHNLMQHQMQQQQQYHQQQQQAAMAAAAAAAAASVQQFDPSFPPGPQVPPVHPVPHSSPTGHHPSGMHPHYFPQYPGHGMAGGPPAMGPVAQPPPPPSSVLGGFSPVPPPGDKPTGHTSLNHQHRQLQKRSSPQVQVPHISQSQIPANAKAASRNQAMMKQHQPQPQQQQQHHHQTSNQQQQQPPSVGPNRSPLVSPYNHPHHLQNPPYPTENGFPGSTSSSTAMMPPPPNPPPGGGVYPGYMYPSYPPSPYPQHHQPPGPGHPYHHMSHHQQQHQQLYPPMSPAGSDLSGMPGHTHPFQPPPPHPHLQVHHHHQQQQQQMCGPQCSGGSQYPPHPGIPIPSQQHQQPHHHPHHPQQQHPPVPCQPYPSRPVATSFNTSTPQHPQHHPMEMSPGCNQVTSSTDRKETTAPPIEDFMENLTSISTENLMENIHSISQDSLNYCGAGAGLQANPAHFASNPAHTNLNPASSQVSMRTESQNSGRSFGNSALLNTSNMVVNDMSSVLTQLAEENKFLNMRP